MKKPIYALVRDQYTTVPPVATADLTGRTVIVVGANTGLGFEAAKHFARMNPGRLILACRNEEKGNEAVGKVAHETGFKAAELWLLNLSEFASVIAFADRFEKAGGRLDILVANAAVLPQTYQVTSDGWEEALQINNLSTSLLCLLLAPRLVETSRKYPGTKPRIVIVSSEVHFWTTLEDEVFDAPAAFRYLSSEEFCVRKNKMGSRYEDTKLLNIFFARSLADLLKDTPVIVNAINPGYCHSEIQRGLSGIGAVVERLKKLVLARTQEQGGRQLVFAAVGTPEHGTEDSLRGAYINLHKVEEPSDFLLGDVGKKRQDKLWNDLLSELLKIDGRVGSIVSELSAAG